MTLEYRLTPACLFGAHPGCYGPASCGCLCHTVPVGVQIDARDQSL